MLRCAALPAGVVLWELLTWELPFGSAELNPFQVRCAALRSARLQVLQVLWKWLGRSLAGSCSCIQYPRNAGPTGGRKQSSPPLSCASRALPQIANAVAGGKRLPIPPPDNLRAGPLQVYDQYVALIESCWQQDPAQRPSFEAIVRDLQ